MPLILKKNEIPLVLLLESKQIQLYQKQLSTEYSTD